MAVNVAENYSDGFGTEQLAYIDNELTFNDAISDFITAAKEKGMEFDKANVSRIFSAMASSRIIVTNGLSAGAFEDLMVILGNYFESAAYIDSVDDTYTSHESVLFRNDAAGNRTKTHAKQPPISVPSPNTIISAATIATSVPAWCTLPTAIFLPAKRCSPGLIPNWQKRGKTP